MLRFVEEATRVGVNENLWGVTSGFVDRYMNGRLGLFRVYIFLMTLYNTRKLDKLGTMSVYPPRICGSGDCNIFKSIASNVFMASS